MVGGQLLVGNEAVAIPLQQLTSGNCQQQVSVQGLVDAENAVKSDHLHEAAALKAIQPVPRAGPHIALTRLCEGIHKIALRPDPIRDL